MVQNDLACNLTGPDGATSMREPYSAGFKTVLVVACLAAGCGDDDSASVATNDDAAVADGTWVSADARSLDDPDTRHSEDSSSGPDVAPPGGDAQYHDAVADTAADANTTPDVNVRDDRVVDAGVEHISPDGIVDAEPPFEIVGCSFSHSLLRREMSIMSDGQVSPYAFESFKHDVTADNRLKPEVLAAAIAAARALDVSTAGSTTTMLPAGHGTHRSGRIWSRASRGGRAVEVRAYKDGATTGYVRIDHNDPAAAVIARLNCFPSN